MGAIACSSDPEGGESSEGNGNSDNGDSSSSAFVDGEVHDLVMGTQTACVLDGEGAVACGGEYHNSFNEEEEEVLADGDWTEIAAGPWSEEHLGLWATEDGEHWEGFGQDLLLDEQFDTMPEGQWSQIVSTHHESCGLDTEGSIQCWGLDADLRDLIGESPDGDGWLRLMRRTNQWEEQTFCAIHTDGDLDCWGRGGGARQQLADGVPDGDQWVDAVISNRVICALEENGNIECWHGSYEPDPRFDTYQEASVEDGTEVRDMAFVNKTLIVVDGQGAINVWGPEEDSISGDEHTLTTDPIDGSGFEQVEGTTLGALVSDQSSSTRGFACALDGEGAMECWGDESMLDVYHEDYFP